MELKLRDGNYVLSAAGLPETVGGAEELLQRALMRLAARRGSFWPEPEYGSRLYTLCRIKAGQRAAAARMFVAEALEHEPEITVKDVVYTPGADGGGSVAVTLSAEGTEAELMLEVEA